MKTTTEKWLIVSLIKDDIVSTKLVNKLNTDGLQADEYLLHLSDTIFKLLGIPDNHQTAYEHYLKLTQKATQIDMELLKITLDDLADDIYQDLMRKQR